MKIKLRLDQKVHELYPTLSRTQIQSVIMQGKVTLNGRTCTKPGTQVPLDSVILVNLEEQKYVSRAGYKLEKALDEFGVDPVNLIVLDSGLSTGGFSDCLLQRGAQKVYGIDVGYGQVHEKLRNDPRVVVMERINLRNLESLQEKVDLVTLDLSFISLLKVMSAVKKLMKADARLITLIKPQFEATREQVGKGGIITDSALHTKIVTSVIDGIEAQGFINKGLIESPILGAEGNKEFLAFFVQQPSP